MDIESLDPPGGIPELAEKLDAVFSNSVIYWCKRNPAGVLESARKVLKKGGRFVGELVFKLYWSGFDVALCLPILIVASSQIGSPACPKLSRV